MKKVLSLMLVAVLMVTLSGCFGNNTETPENKFPTFSGIDSTVTVEVGDTFDPLAGVTANDEEDGDITSSITVTGTDCLSLDSNNVVGETAGGATCALLYKVEDSDGGKAQKSSSVTVEVVVDVTENALVNGDFELGPNAWANTDGSLLDLYNSAVGTAAVNEGVLEVVVTTPSWDGSAPRVNQEGLAFENGKTYEVSFEAKASVAAELSSQVGIFLQSDPWFKTYYYNVNSEGEASSFMFDLTTTMQTFTYKFTVTEDTTAEGTITFELGKNQDATEAITFYFDNIVLKESTPDPDLDAPVLEGLDEVTITTEDTFDAVDGVTVSDFDTTVDMDDVVITHDGGTDVTVETDGTYSFAAEGVYTFTYTVSDSSSNTANPTRVVNVVGDAEAPMISGLEYAYVVNGFAWNPLMGISFTDNIDDTLTMDDFVVVVKNAAAETVTADANGLYTLTTNGLYQVLYTLVDTSGNAANAEKWVSVVDAPTGMTNLVTEGDFAAMTEWGSWLADWNASAATFDATSGAMVVDVTNVGEDTWHVQLFNETVDFVNGTTYVLTFEASSTVARDILVEIIDGANQYAVSLKDTTQRFSFEYTAGADVTDAKLNFLLGAVNGAAASTITIDNVMIYEKVENANGVTEGDFAAITEWGNWLADWNATAATFDATSGAMVINATNVGEDTWHIQLFNETVDFTAGTIYTVSFEASATVDRDIFFEVIDGVNQYKASLTSTSEMFTFSYLANADVTDAKINFLLGLVNAATAGEITIDNVSITANPVN